jgi:hypothetical protein
MDKKGNQICTITRAPQLIERRSFLGTGTLALATLVLSPLFGRGPFAADKHRYKLAPESLLPTDIRKAPVEVREAYRFAIANRETYVTFLVIVVVGTRVTRATLLVIFKATQHRKNRYSIE